MVSKLDLYKVFWMVGRKGSFSKAASELYMTQPAVSQSIMALEKELDTRLFTRTARGVLLTTEGAVLFEYIQSALQFIEAGEEKLLEYKNLTAGELRIGVGDTISRYFLLPYLEAFHNRYPQIKFKIENGTTAQICTLLKSGEVDIGVCNFPIEDSTLHLQACADVHDIFVCGEKYKEMLRKPIGLKELIQYPLIFLEPSSNSRKYVEEYILSKGVRIAPEFDLGSYDLLLEFAKINLGIACVTREFSKEYLEEGILYEVPLTEEIPKRSIGICSLKSVPLTRAATVFIEQFK